MPQNSKPGSRSRNPARCQRINVFGWTTTSASRQLNNLESKANVMRVAGSIRRGSTLRSWYSASCRRRKEILSGDRLSRPDEQTEIDDEISDQLKEDAGSRHDAAIMPEIPSGFGQNRGILFFAENKPFDVAAQEL